MKTIKYALIALFISSMAYSQEEKKSYGFNKGDIFISTALNYGGFDSIDAFYIRPSAGYFLTSNISLGLQSEFLVSESSNFSSINSFGIGINGRYYFMPKKRFNVFAELALDKTTEKRTSTFLNRNTESEVHQLSATISTGINFFITKKFSVFAKADLWKFSRTIFKSQTSEDFFQIENKRTDYRSGIQDLSIGLQFKF
ncbi:outer membrane beta-barrel protein [uncultured Aquimarina sp.]|uniref:outer membrane beta-barrel protein n=1 Tax=uncultured Aquimarina sp. TaxID=575652 RepID=UPI00261DD621|nr:outer membrane beta-barrel protein [uncultured Aquimarina sp.]